MTDKKIITLPADAKEGDSITIEAESGWEIRMPATFTYYYPLGEKEK